MRFLRFTLLQSYILSIQKNKRKALLIINTGIFLAIFAFTSATISFFIEKKISDIQNELTVSQIETRQVNNIISFFENELNTLEKFLLKEDNIKSEKRFLDVFKNVDDVIKCLARCSHPSAFIYIVIINIVIFNSIFSIWNEYFFVFRISICLDNISFIVIQSHRIHKAVLLLSVS